MRVSGNCNCNGNVGIADSHMRRGGKESIPIPANFSNFSLLLSLLPFSFLTTAEAG